MIALDESALECDLAEYYNIYDYRSLSPERVATFSVGLREDSRIKMKIAGLKHPLNTILLASAVDKLQLLLWSKTKDGAKNKNRPPSVLAKLLNQQEEEKESDIEAYDSAEEFEAAMKEFDEKHRR